jgi:hypothetical protein
MAIGEENPLKENQKKQQEVKAKLEKEESKKLKEKFSKERKQEDKEYTNKDYNKDKKNTEIGIKAISERERNEHRATEKSLKKDIPKADKEARRQIKEDRKFKKEEYKKAFSEDGKIGELKEEVESKKKLYYAAKKNVPFFGATPEAKEDLAKASKELEKAKKDLSTKTTEVKQKLELDLANNKIEEFKSHAKNREAYAEQIHDRHQHVQDKLLVKALHLNPPLMLTDKQQERYNKIKKLPDGDKKTQEIAKEKKHLREYIQGPITRDDKGMISVEFKHPTMDKDKSVFYKINPNNPDPKTFQLVNRDGVSVDEISALKPTTIAKPNFNGIFGIKNEQTRLHERQRKEEKPLHKDDAKFQKAAEKKAEIEKKQRKSEYKEKKENLKREIKEAKRENKQFVKEAQSKEEKATGITAIQTNLKDKEKAKSEAFNECLKHPLDKEKREAYRAAKEAYSHTKDNLSKVQEKVYKNLDEKIGTALIKRDDIVKEKTAELKAIESSMAQSKNDAKIVKDLKLNPPIVVTADQVDRYKDAFRTRNDKLIEKDLADIGKGELKYVQGKIERVDGKIRVEYKHPDGNQEKNIYCFIDPKTKKVEQYGYEPEARAMIEGQKFTGPDGRTHNYMIIDAPSAPAPRDMGVGKVNNASPAPSPSASAPAVSKPTQDLPLPPDPKSLPPLPDMEGKAQPTLAKGISDAEAKPKEAPKPLTIEELRNNTMHGDWTVEKKLFFNKETTNFERTLSHNGGKNQLKEIRNMDGKLLEVHVLEGDAAITLDRKDGKGEVVGKQQVTFVDGKPVDVKAFDTTGKIIEDPMKAPGKLDVGLKKVAKKDVAAKFEIQGNGQSVIVKDDKLKDKAGNAADKDGNEYTIKKLTDGHKAGEFRDVDPIKVVEKMKKNSTVEKGDSRAQHAPKATPTSGKTNSTDKGIGGI